MKKFELKKYVNDQLEETHTVPVAFIRILTAILPVSAIEGLNQAGFNFNALIEASKQGQEFHSSTTVEEHGVMKRIEINLL